MHILYLKGWAIVLPFTNLNMLYTQNENRMKYRPIFLVVAQQIITDFVIIVENSRTIYLQYLFLV